MLLINEMEIYVVYATPVLDKLKKSNEHTASAFFCRLRQCNDTVVK